MELKGVSGRLRPPDEEQAQVCGLKHRNIRWAVTDCNDLTIRVSQFVEVGALALRFAYVDLEGRLVLLPPNPLCLDKKELIA